MATKGLATEKLVEQLKGSLKKPAKKDKPKLPTKAKGPTPKPAPVQRAARYAISDIITLTPKGKERNWKRPGSDAEALYEIYLKNPKGLTVGKYVELAKATKRPKAGRTAINWDVARKYITVSSK